MLPLPSYHTAPAHPHATDAAVYTALFMRGSRATARQGTEYYRMGRFSVGPSPLWVIQPGLRPSKPGLKPEAWLTGCLGLRPGWLGLRSGWLAQRGDERMNVQKISPFYRTSSPIGAAAQKLTQLQRRRRRGRRRRRTRSEREKKRRSKWNRRKGGV